MTRTTTLHWDYTPLAPTYDQRPDYHAGLVARVLRAMQLPAGTPVLEVGAGTGKLTAHLCRHGLRVIASEPNASMRALALAKPELQQVGWLACLGEALPLKARTVGLVAYGSSFNVLQAREALDECARVLQPGGWWLALWNHRDFNDPLQQAVETLIRRHIPHYDYGQRRASPVPDLHAHGGFGRIEAAEERFEVDLSSDAWMQAWHAHATLQRQAGQRLPQILDEIRGLLGNAGSLRIPYFTRLWSAQRKGA